MAFDVIIDIREAAALADAFDKSPKIVTEELTAATWQASLLLEREVKELRRANEILKTASAFFAAAELDRRLK